MGADNGGMVVNLSEGGLGFQAVGPVIPRTEIAISFSLGTAYRIDVRVRVAWVSEEGKIGGATFGKLSKDSQSLIREWVAKANPHHETEQEDKVPYVVLEADGRAAHEPDAAMASRTVRPDQGANQAREPLAKISVLGIEEVAAQNGVVLPSYGAKSPEVCAESPIAHDSASIASPVTDVHATGAVALPRNPSAQETSKTAPTQTAAPDAVATAARVESDDARLSQKGGIPRQREPEQKPERQGTGSFLAVPSISAWSRKEAAQSSINQPNVQNNATPLSPLRNTENIFARSSPQTEAVQEKSGSSKLFVIALVIAAAAVGAFYVRTHRRQIGTVITQIGAKVAGNPVSSGSPASAAAVPPAKSKDSSATTPTPVKGALSDSQNAAPKSQAAVPTQAAPAPTAKQTTNTNTPNSTAASLLIPAGSKSTSANTATGGAKATVQIPSASPSSQRAHGASKGANTVPATAASLQAGQSDYQRAEQYLNGQGVAQDYSEAAQWFWRSLEAGYTNAALPLANLYLDGNGVSRSCTQARILLDAAAQKNNAQAIQKLAQLPDNCQ